MKIELIGYFCSVSECEFHIHVKCARVVEVADEQACIRHPSHPQHQLVLVKKKHSFQCDACGTMEKGRSYVCVTCQYWIHERCAALPATADYLLLHHHPLSLAFYLPTDYVKFRFQCDICGKQLPLYHWTYHCHNCRYYVHIKCALTPPTATASASSDDANAGDDQGVIQFPIDNFPQELIKPFVIRERGEMIIPCNDLQKYCFPLHHHQLSLVSSSLSEIKDDDEDEDEDEDDDVALTCDACTMPIFHKEKHQSSSSSSCPDYKYMSCGECRYFLHMACFNLPPELPSHPLHKAHDHKLILQACPKLDFINCSICGFSTNGLYYSCTECDFKADIKCASLPTTIKHASHPHHHLYLKFVPKPEITLRQGICGGCLKIILYGTLYKCGSCDFILCRRCAMLPQVNKHKGEKHPLPLTYDARINHPDDFYCDACEGEMNPRAWMYHCRPCDTSFHATCFLQTSGYCRNIKFGQQYNVSADLHPHPLTYRLLTTKLRCDVCRLRVYGQDRVDQTGFHCSSCNFFMCHDRCGRSHEIFAID